MPKKNIKVVVNPALVGFKKSAQYKGETYVGGEVYSLPEDSLVYRTKHFGSVVPSFITEEAAEAMQPEGDGTIIE